MSVVRVVIFPLALLSYTMSAVLGFFAIVLSHASNKFLTNGDSLSGWGLGDV